MSINRSHGAAPNTEGREKGGPTLVVQNTKNDREQALGIEN